MAGDGCYLPGLPSRSGITSSLVARGQSCVTTRIGGVGESRRKMALVLVDSGFGP